MGVITVEKTDHLFWLGRYIERAYTTLKQYIQGYDTMIDLDEEEYYLRLCEAMAIPDTYGSKEAFISGFGYDRSNSYSIISNIYHAYDNAMVIRDEIGTDTLAYIHMVIDMMEKAKTSSAPIFDLQRVIDNILAFWGSLDDEIDSEITRNTVKAGKRFERLDMYIRFKRSRQELMRELNRFEFRLERSYLTYKKAPLKHTDAMIEDDSIDYDALLEMVEKIF